MSKYKICVYAICKNEEQFADRWMDSMGEADIVVVTDTGSTDDTVQKLRDRGAIVYIEEIKPWRFDIARNASLAHVPDDTDICVCTDLDEVFVPGWRKKLEEAWEPDASMARYIYNWSLKEDGSPDVQFFYFKIHAKAAYAWAHPVHECLRYIGSGPEKKVLADGVVLNHYPDGTKSRGSYLPLLEMAVEEEPLDDRMMYYLGREYMYSSQWEKSIETLKRHLALPTSIWREERCASMRWIAKSYAALSDLPEAKSWYLRAIAECPWMREPYIECAKMGYSAGEWEMVFFMVEEALKIPEKSKVYVNMGYCWDYTPYDLGAICAYRLGMYEKSFVYAKEALRISPEDNRLKNNLESIRLKTKKRKD